MKASPQFKRAVETALRRLREARGSLTMPERHQLAIAKKTLKMSDAGAMVMGGMTKDEAREIVFNLTGKRPSEATAQTKSNLSSGKKRVDDALREANYAINAFNTQVQQAARSEPESRDELVTIMKANGKIAGLIGQALQTWANVKRTV